MSQPGLNILIADDHELIREGLKRILLEAGQVRRIGEAPDGPQALEMARRDKWDIAILDINLPFRNGLEVLKDIKAEQPALPVLMLSMYPEEQFGVRAVRAGADGYVTKATAQRVLIEAIRIILAGGKYVSPMVADKLMAAGNRAGDKPSHEILSDREDQVFRLIASGRTVGEIAAELRLSVKTVSTYRAHILQKLGLENNAQLMRYAADHGLVV